MGLEKTVLAHGLKELAVDAWSDRGAFIQVLNNLDSQETETLERSEKECDEALAREATGMDPFSLKHVNYVLLAEFFDHWRRLKLISMVVRRDTQRSSANKMVHNRMVKSQFLLCPEQGSSSSPSIGPSVDIRPIL